MQFELHSILCNSKGEERREKGTQNVCHIIFNSSVLIKKFMHKNKLYVSRLDIII